MCLHIRTRCHEHLGTRERMFLFIFIVTIGLMPQSASQPTNFEFPTPRLSYNITPHHPPLYGLPKLNLSGLVQVSYGGSHSVVGSYQHGPMIGEVNNVVLLSWKNSPISEDEPGQRVFYSHATDPTAAPGTQGGWSTPTLLFPGLLGNTTHESAANCDIALWAAPFVTLRGHVYAAAGTQQICLFPADRTKAESLLLRRITVQNSSTDLTRSTSASVKLGPIFWAGPNGTAPTPCQARAGIAAGVYNLAAMDVETQADVATLRNGETASFPMSDPSSKASPPSVASTAAPGCSTPTPSNPTPKCESCVKGCQSIEQFLNGSYVSTTPCRLKLPWAERTHYGVPNTTTDVLLYETTQHRLCYSVRADPHSPWADLRESNIPSVDANCNAGVFPRLQHFILNSREQETDNFEHDTETIESASMAPRVYLLSNPSAPSDTQVSFTSRDPLVLSLSSDGANFDKGYVVASCTTAPFSNPQQPNGCLPRRSQTHAPGPQYPQGMVRFSQGHFLIAFSNNKEDIWVATATLATIAQS